MADPVVVIGGGIAGIQAATDLAEMGVPVYLIEKSPSLGGRMAQLDKTFPTNDCSTCILAPKITSCYNHKNVTTYTMTEMVGLEGEPGDFRVRLKKRPRYIDEEKCTGCTECFEKCPVTIPDEYNLGLAEQKAVHKYQPQAVPNLAVIDPEQCLKLTQGKCGLCERICSFDAVNYEQKEKNFIVQAAAVVFAPGYESFEGDLVSQYNYGVHENVITSLEYERILNAAGPTDGRVIRPSDGKEVNKIAFLHCSGSRDFQRDKNYCSSVCCMYSIKHALLTRDHLKDAEIDLYYMDIRSHGKGFERYYNRAEATEGVNFIRSRVAEIERTKSGNQLKLKVTDGDNGFASKEYDLVVLATGLAPNQEVTDDLQKLKVRTNKYGFADTDEFSPQALSRPGIFGCGAITGPKDIPESVAEASGSAALAGQLAALDVKELGISEAPPPANREITNQRTRVGVFVCHCGTNIAGVIDVEEVARRAGEIPFVEWSEDVKYLCSTDSQDLIADRIREHDLNRILIVSCSPRTHEMLFQNAVTRAGLNPHLMEMTNIRDQGSWVHKEEKEKATWKAYEMVRAGIARIKNALPLERGEVDNITRALILGGGAAGLTAARELARLGFPVSLVEKADWLGGKAAQINRSSMGRPVKPFLERLVQEVKNNQLIDIYSGYDIQDISGFVGNYQLALSGPKDVEIEGGVVVVATGAEELEPEEYLYQNSSKVMTQLELEDKLTERSPELQAAESIYMIQCVGSREEDRPYCSRLCCTQALRNAIELKQRNPNREITILYRELRSYGYYEELYREARDLGINFSRYEVDNKPEVYFLNGEKDSLGISFTEPLTATEIKDEADLVILAAAVLPGESNEQISKFLKTPLNEDNFFLEAHVKLRPVDSATDGIFLTGLAHGPKNLIESISQSRAAAGRAASILAKEFLLTEAMIAEVDDDLCIGCGDCERVCAYKAIEVDPETGKAEVNRVLCKGCGNCLGVCRPNAVDLNGFRNQQILDEVEALLAEGAMEKGELV
ncbi:MAG: FAD-dependent oxidoreductase [Bacillota bacterium]